MDLRDYKDPKYKAWRKKVFARDKFKCRMPGCRSGDKTMNAHHIKKWATFPSLRFVLSNGITLCRTCHERVSGHEEEHEATFTRIVNVGGTDAAMALLLLRHKKKREDELNDS